MRRALLIGAVVAAGAGVGAGTVLASGALGEDAPVEVITVPAGRPPPGRRSSSSRTASPARTRSGCRGRALAEVAGTAISAERDDGLYQVEVRDRTGRHLEVLLDDGFRVVGTDDD